MRIVDCLIGSLCTFTVMQALADDAKSAEREAIVDVVRARSIELVDEQGRVRMTLGERKWIPEVNFFDEEDGGEIEECDYGLHVFDETGRVRVFAGEAAFGRENYGLTLSGIDGTTSAELMADTFGDVGPAARFAMYASGGCSINMRVVDTRGELSLVTPEPQSALTGLFRPADQDEENDRGFIYHQPQRVRDL